MKLIVSIVLSILYISGANAIWFPMDPSSLVIAPRIRRNSDPKQNATNQLKIYEMNLYTNVTNRYAKTVITTKAKNNNELSQEAHYSLVIPDLAFISDFKMEIDKKIYKAFVEETEQAKKTYGESSGTGQSAGLVTASARDSKRFTVQITVEPQSTVVFYLTYEQLLRRNDYKYEIVLNIQPGQLVDKLEAQVDINESVNIETIGTPDLRNGGVVSRQPNDNLRPQADIIWKSRTAATVKFHASIEKQKRYAWYLNQVPENGFLGQFVVEYDVVRDAQGELIVDDCCYAHFFAPKNLKPIPKYIVFVLDTSHSMFGPKLHQLKEAMDKILGDLRREDLFTIIDFNSNVNVWNVEEKGVQYKYDYTNYPSENKNLPLPPPTESTKANIIKTKNLIYSFATNGYTDISTSLSTALELLRRYQGDHQCLIAFLTDGQPNRGIEDKNELVSAVKQTNTANSPIFTIALGEDANRDLLGRIAQSNHGFFKRIYAELDVALQLEDFYREISTPVLTNVAYNVKGVTNSNLNILFGGKEMVLTGKKGLNFIPPSVNATSKDGAVCFSPTMKNSVGSLERLLAYMTLQQMLENKTVTGNNTYSTEALKLAKKYSFVSEVSSLVVETPNGITSAELRDAYELPNPSVPNNTSTSTPSPNPNPSDSNKGTNSTPYRNDKEEYGQPDKSKMDIVKDAMTWLHAVTNADGTIRLSKGNYSLGLEQPFEEGLHCENSPRESTITTCRLLDACSPVYQLISSVQQFEQYMCLLKGFVGVCCPH